MGLLVYTDYRSLEGAALSTVYCRVENTNVSFPKDGSTTVAVTVYMGCYVSRDAATGGYRQLINSPVPPRMVLTIPSTDTWNSLSYIYAKIKEELGKTFDHIEDVLEGEQVPVGMTQ